VLCGYVSESRSFPPEEVQFVETVANLLGTALEHRETDRHRRESDARFREIAEVSPDTIFRLDVDGTLTYVSPAVGSLLGYDPEDLVGSHFGEHVADGYVEAAVEGFNRVRSGTTVRELEVTLTAADGTRVPSELSASPVHRDGEVAVVQGVVRDISERKAVERAIREANARYRTLVEHFPDGGVFLFDHDLRYTLAGGDELGAVGLSSADFEGTRPANLFPEDIAEETVSHYRKALDGDSHTFEQRYEGSVYRVRTLPIHDDDGEVASGMAVSQNVTDRRRRERELERQNERLSEFASIVSHDLRNPLLVATARLELAEAECESEHLEDVARAHDRMEALIKDLLTLARQGETATDVELLDLPTLVETCWRNVRTERAKLVVETDRRIRAEKGRLEQLLENLIGNAVEHAGDDVTVTVGDLDDGFFFEDDGRGVPDSAREDIFEAGYSTVPKGTGFGLNIVEEVANAHGWTVDLCESAAGGARFEVRDVGLSR
jgi:PAS domain S-box-containing protein